jgi:hypothetical protein
MMMGRIGPLGGGLAKNGKRRNTGVLHFVQDDDLERETADATARTTTRTTTRATTTADPYGMTNKKTGKSKSNGKCKSNDKCEGNSRSLAGMTSKKAKATTNATALASG